MGNLTLKGKDLDKIGYTSDKTKSIALNIVSKHLKHYKYDETIAILGEILKGPEHFCTHPFWGKLANEMIAVPEQTVVAERKMLHEPKPFVTFGKQFIEPQAIHQMELAMSLPVSEIGALMPDAHQGFGLPIGGVLATRDVVIPYAIGMDIGCRMSLSIFDSNASYIKKNHYQIETALLKFTQFGMKADAGFNCHHEVLDSPIFKEITLARKLHGKAIKQLGTSGSGNHFVEFGVVSLTEYNSLGIPPGDYLGLLSHSGSRGLGAEIANTYTRLAMEKIHLPHSVQHMAWLDLNSDVGTEYWHLMSLAGEYAKACHDIIHWQLAKALGIKRMTTIENHHNFAWKQMHHGIEYIVHRKGATPASNGELGIIPGSMTSKAFIVRGFGNDAALNSASHGAGRKMTRNKAKCSLTMGELKKHLKQNNVTLLGGGIDESPFVYKNIEEIMLAQQKLVEPVGTFQPAIVRMDKQ